MDQNGLDGILKRIEIAKRRCDQCYQKHQQCNKAIPTCSRCSRLNLECTWNRPILKQTWKRYENVDKFSSKDKQICVEDLVLSQLTKTPKKVSGLKMPIQLGQETFSTFSTNLKSNICFPNDLVLVFENWSSRADTRSELSYFSSLAGLPFYGATVNDKLFLGKFLLTKKPPKFNNQEYCIPDYHQLYFTLIFRNELLQTAFDAYFHYLNPFFPLFTRFSYESRPRSEFLQLTIWRIGLQFLDNSFLKTVLIKEFEEKLINYIRPSCLVWNLDTFQAIMALCCGIYEGPLQSKVVALFNIATTMVHCLGLSFRCTPLYSREYYNELLLFERYLALTQLNRADEICFLRSGEFSMSTLYNSTHSLKAASSCLSSWDHCLFMEPILLIQTYFTSLLRSNRKFNLPSKEKNSFQTSTTEHTEILSQSSIPVTFYTNPAEVMDICIFITSLCSNTFINIFKKVQSVFNQFQVDGKSDINLISAVNQAKKQLFEAFVQGFQHLHCVKLISSVVFVQLSVYCTTYHLNPDPFSTNTNLFELYNCPTENLVISQMQLILYLRYLLFKILILDLGIRINILSARTLTPKYIDSCAKKFTLNGISCAYKLISLVSLISAGQFTILRDFLLMIPSRFIIQHFHSYFNQLNNVQSSTQTIVPLPNPTNTDLINCINKTKEIFTSLMYAPVGSYYMNANLVLLEELVKKFHFPM